MSRVYLDWNATAPLRSEARAAMIAAMDAVGNPSSVHAEGRKALTIIETARKQIKTAFGAENADVVFTSGATEAAMLALSTRNLSCTNIEHDAVVAWCNPSEGSVDVLQAANSETGVLQTDVSGMRVCDAVQAFGKIPFAFEWSGADMALLSSHKIGGPKGVGAVVLKQGLELPFSVKQAAQRDLDSGVWEPIEAMRNAFEARILDAAPDAIIVGKGEKRLPNTSCIAVPGWKGETQVMQMDLAGFAISAGSACSSGKVKRSRVLNAMGYDDTTASSAVRVSIGPTTTQSDLSRFADAWIAQYNKFKARAA